VAEPSDPSQAFDALNDEIDHLTHEELIEVGHAAIALVVARTKKGLDADGNKFAAYKPAYARVRAKAAVRVSPPDLVRTGHMLAGMQPLVTGQNEVTISFPSDLEAKKAATNNDGCKELVDVSPHKRGAYFDTSKGGQRVSRKDWKKDQRRKNKRVVARTEKVGAHERQMDTPAREFLDIRRPRELEFIQNVASEIIARRVEGKIK
jgi:hypothetical protein